MSFHKPTFDLPAIGTIKGAAKGSRLHLDEYQSWHQACRRCHTPNGRGYERYGLKGIRVCDRWRKSFLAFVADLGPRPPGYQLDREDGTKGYYPGNARWVSAKVNVRNRSITLKYEWEGKLVPLGELAERYGISHDVIRHRVEDYGWSLERALTTPKQPHGGAYRLKFEDRPHNQPGRQAAE